MTNDQALMSRKLAHAAKNFRHSSTNANARITQLPACLNLICAKTDILSFYRNEPAETNGPDRMEYEVGKVFQMYTAAWTPIFRAGIPLSVAIQ